MDGLKEAVAAVRESLSSGTLDRWVAALGHEIAGPAGFALASRAEELVEELQRTRAEAARMGVELRRPRVKAAVRSDDPDVLGTSRFFGRERCSFRGCEYRRIDERNLGQCRELYVGEARIEGDEYGSAVSRLDERYLGRLEKLDASGSELSSLGTAFLASLKSLDVGFTPMRSLDAGPLAALEELGFRNTAISSLNTSHLHALAKLDVRYTKLAFLDARPLGRLEELLLERCPARYLQTTGLPLMKYLSICRSALLRIQVQNGWRIKGLYAGGGPIRFVDCRGRCSIWYMDDGDCRVFCDDRS